MLIFPLLMLALLSWSMLKYPIPKDKRIKLAKLYFHISITPGMSPQMIATCADGFKALTTSKEKLSISDMRLPWKPIYDVLSHDLFLRRRQFEYTCVGFRHCGASVLTLVQSSLVVYGVHCGKCSQVFSSSCNQ